MMHGDGDIWMFVVVVVVPEKFTSLCRKSFARIEFNPNSMPNK